MMPPCPVLGRVRDGMGDTTNKEHGRPSPCPRGIGTWLGNRQAEFRGLGAEQEEI